MVRVWFLLTTAATASSKILVELSKKVPTSLFPFLGTDMDEFNILCLLNEQKYRRVVIEVVGHCTAAFPLPELIGILQVFCDVKDASSRERALAHLINSVKGTLGEEYLMSLMVSYLYRFCLRQKTATARLKDIKKSVRTKAIKLLFTILEINPYASLIILHNRYSKVLSPMSCPDHTMHKEFITLLFDSALPVVFQLLMVHPNDPAYSEDIVCNVTELLEGGSTGKSHYTLCYDPLDILPCAAVEHEKSLQTISELFSKAMMRENANKLQQAINWCSAASKFVLARNR
jgi:hypothetical protein